MARENDKDLEHTGYRSGRVRIVGAEPAGRSAARRPDPEADLDDKIDEEEPGTDSDPDAQAFVVPPLPHWTEPATGEVPAILSREHERAEADPYPSLRGPTWREGGADWEAQDEGFDPSMLVGDQSGQGSLDAGNSDRQPWVFDLPGTGSGVGNLLDEGAWGDAGDAEWDDLSLSSPPAPGDDGPVTAVLPVVGPAEPDADVPPLSEFETPEPLGNGTGEPVVVDDLDAPFEAPPSRLRSLRPSERRAARQTEREAFPAPPPRRTSPVDRLRPPTGPEPEEASPRNLTAAIVSGLVLGGLVLITFKIGSAAAVGLVTLVVTLAAAEAFAAFRHGGYHPVTLLGLVATVSLMIAAYNKGEAALPLVLVLLVAACLVWHLAGVEHTDAVRSTGTTLFVFGWVAVFGSFGALLLSPSLFPARHGIAYLLGAVIAGVAYDVGALTFGAWLGRHPMASVSPHKTWEGFVGGLVTSLVLTVVIVHMIHPWTVGKAAALALVVSVVATLGDLFESTVKRHLGLKDMGRLLPGHGGVLDRIDGLLFALPATYYLVIAFHLG
jgi:phosphatidate cytidylyltransferase